MKEFVAGNKSEILNRVQAAQNAVRRAPTVLTVGDGITLLNDWADDADAPFRATVMHGLAYTSVRFSGRLVAPGSGVGDDMFDLLDELRPWYAAAYPVVNVTDSSTVLCFLRGAGESGNAARLLSAVANKTYAFDAVEYYLEAF